MSRTPAVVNWIFVVNNYTPEDEELFASLPCGYLLYGREVGKNGTPHLQGYLQLESRKRLSAMKKIHPGAHWEPAKGDHASNYQYCTKDGDFVERGTPRVGKKGAPSMEERIRKNKRLRDTPMDELLDSGELHMLDVRKLKNARLDLAQEIPAFAASDVRGIWIWGPPGVGKSRKARADYGDDVYLKAQNKWWDGYTGQKTVILDDMDCDVLGHHLKIWTDRYACTGEVKGGIVNLRHERFIVTSNFSIEELFEKPQIASALRRRFHVIHMDEKFNQ